mgnify:CR=1 FL=1
MKETNTKLDIKDNFQTTIEDYIPRILSESDAGVICVQTSTPTTSLRKIEHILSQQSEAKNHLLVVDVTPYRSPLNQLADFFARKDSCLNKDISLRFNLSFSAALNGSVTFTNKCTRQFEDIGIEIEHRLIKLQRKNTKLIICTDHTNNNPDMQQFLCEFKKWQRVGYPVYLLYAQNSTKKLSSDECLIEFNGFIEQAIMSDHNIIKL